MGDPSRARPAAAAGPRAPRGRPTLVELWEYAPPKAEGLDEKENAERGMLVAEMLSSILSGPKAGLIGLKLRMPQAARDKMDRGGYEAAKALLDGGFLTEPAKIDKFLAAVWEVGLQGKIAIATLFAPRAARAVKEIPPPAGDLCPVATSLRTALQGLREKRTVGATTAWQFQAKVPVPAAEAAHPTNVEAQEPAVYCATLVKFVACSRKFSHCLVHRTGEFAKKLLDRCSAEAADAARRCGYRQCPAHNVEFCMHGVDCHARRDEFFSSFVLANVPDAEEWLAHHVNNVRNSCKDGGYSPCDDGEGSSTVSMWGTQDSMEPAVAAKLCDLPSTFGRQHRLFSSVDVDDPTMTATWLCYMMANHNVFMRSD